MKYICATLFSATKQPLERTLATLCFIGGERTRCFDLVSYQCDCAGP